MNLELKSVICEKLRIRVIRMPISVCLLTHRYKNYMNLKFKFVIYYLKNQELD